MGQSFSLSWFFASVLIVAFSHLGDAQASTIRFDVSFSTGDTGYIEIDEGYLVPDATIATRLGTVSFSVNGLTFDRPQAGAVTFFQIDATGTKIVSMLSPGPGKFIPFGVTASSAQTINFSEGAVPGNFKTRNVLGGDVSGTYSIADGEIVLPPTTAPVPLPASAWALLGALGVLGATGLVTRRHGARCQAAANSGGAA